MVLEKSITDYILKWQNTEAASVKIRNMNKHLGTEVLKGPPEAALLECKRHASKDMVVYSVCN